jgi:hypothetical protein
MENLLLQDGDSVLLQDGGLLLFESASEDEDNELYDGNTETVMIWYL